VLQVQSKPRTHSAVDGEVAVGVAASTGASLEQQINPSRSRSRAGPRDPRTISHLACRGRSSVTKWLRRQAMHSSGVESAGGASTAAVNSFGSPSAAARAGRNAQLRPGATRGRATRSVPAVRAARPAATAAAAEGAAGRSGDRRAGQPTLTTSRLRASASIAARAATCVPLECPTSTTGPGRASSSYSATAAPYPGTSRLRVGSPLPAKPGSSTRCARVHRPSSATAGIR
jgi:hypothetical protein